MPGDVTRLYRIKYVVVDGASAPLAAMAKTFIGLNVQAEASAVSVGAVGRYLGQLRQHVGTLNGIDVAMRRVQGSAAGLALNLDGTTDALKKSGNALRTFRDLQRALKSDGFKEINDEAMKMVTSSRTVRQLVENLTRAQRAAYGLKMNIQEGNAALQGLVVSGQGLGQTAGQLGAVGAATKPAAAGIKGMALGLAAFQAKMAALNLARDVAGAFGESMERASEFAKSSADEVIRIRDGLRELANLQKKSSVDDETLRGAVALRQATGFTEKDARSFGEQYLGSRPLAVAKGNITEKVADDAAREIGRSAVRVGLDAKTAGDLAGSVGAFGPIKSSNQAVGQVQQVIDQLNDGRGNLTPLVKELMKGGFATVGNGNAFRSIAERAAGLRVTTGIVGNAGQASTALGAAIRGLTGFTKSQGETLAAHGVKSGQDLPTMIEKIAPLVERAEAAGKNASAALASAGFGNKQDRDAIIGLVKNRRVLRQAVDSVREDERSPTAKAEAAGERAADLNRRFYASDRSAANRVADANLEAGKVERGLVTEPLAIARKNAEGQLLRENQLDTTGALLSQRLRGLASPQWLTGVDQRQKDIDERARENLRKEGERVGVKVPGRNWGTAEGGLTEDLNRYGPEIRRRGGDPYGGKAAAVPPDPEVLKRLDRIADAVEKQKPAREPAADLPGRPVPWESRL